MRHHFKRNSQRTFKKCWSDVSTSSCFLSTLLKNFNLFIHILLTLAFLVCRSWMACQQLTWNWTTWFVHVSEIGCRGTGYHGAPHCKSSYLGTSDFQLSSWSHWHCCRSSDTLPFRAQSSTTFGGTCQSMYIEIIDDSDKMRVHRTKNHVQQWTMIRPTSISTRHLV